MTFYELLLNAKNLKEIKRLIDKKKKDKGNGSKD